jgi:hypothetical protein
MRTVRRRLLQVLPDGFFEITIRGVKGRNGKQELFVEGGKSEKITIPDEDIDDVLDDS